MTFEKLKNNNQNPDLSDRTTIDSTSDILTQDVFFLLEERLQVELTRRKIGEIVIRKEIETQLVTVQVPIRREKLIVEQVSPVYELLAEIDLGQASNSGTIVNPTNDEGLLVDRDRKSSSILHSRRYANDSESPPENTNGRITPPTVYGSTDSLKAASELLNEIAHLTTHDCGTVRIEIELKDSKHQASYQSLVDRYCQA